VPVIEAISLKIKLNIAPIDTAILGLVQLVQPTSPERLKSEAAGTMLEALCRRNQMDDHLARLERDGFLLRGARGTLMVAPKEYELVSRGLNPKARDKARLLWLNEERYK